MRTPNCKCVICGKQLYRRPYELKSVRYVACLEHRHAAQVAAGVTDAQTAALSKGRTKGTNHREGYRHRDESKQKASESHKKWCAENKEKVAARGEKNRGVKHYRWNGGSSRLNTSIRQMSENRKWTDSVRQRDGKCTKCGSVENLEVHHLAGLSVLINTLRIKNRDDARRFTLVLWDVNNGVTFCKKCHFQEHGRTFNDD